MRILYQSEKVAGNTLNKDLGSKHTINKIHVEIKSIVNIEPNTNNNLQIIFVEII